MLLVGAVGIDIGDDTVTASLDKAALTGGGVATIDVASFGSNHTLQSYQRYSGTTFATASVDNTGDDHSYSFDYTGYGENMPGPDPLFTAPQTASAGNGASIPSPTDDANATISTATATMAPRLSTLSFFAELKNGGSEVFAGTSTGFVSIGDVSIGLSGNTASFTIGAGQAPGLAAIVAAGGQANRLEVAGYDSSGRALDYVLIGPTLSASTTDAATGLDDVTLGYAYIQSSAAGMSATTSPIGTVAVDAPQDAPLVCFVAGTRIRSSRGDIAVEDLVVGELVVTASGAHRPIRWLGHRTIDCRVHRAPHAVWPIRVAADAFGRDRPLRDLYVSPEHSLCVDVVEEVLIPAGALVNGSTITHAECDSVTYWHVELEGGHDILWADGMPAESFLEMGANRALLGLAFDDLPVDVLARTHADFCRPFHQSGPIVEIVRARLAARAERLGWQEPAREHPDLRAA